MAQVRPFAEIFAVLCCGLFAGAAVYVTLVEHPARMECGVELAVAEFAPSYRRASRMQALLAIFGSLSAALAWIAGASIAWLLGAILFFSVVPFTLLAILPTNRQLLDKSLDLQSIQASALLARWNRLHAVRTVVSWAAFILFLKLLVIS
jgi:Domain of unknown function (DUF1772)